MSSPINKVISNLPQAFTTAEQKQARDNISAQAKISYSYSGSTITAIDGSAVGNPASLTAAYANNCISGDGTSGSPLGLSATARWTGINHYPMTEISAGHIKISADAFAKLQIYQNESSLCYMQPTALTVRHTASGVGGGYIDNFYGEILNLSYNAGEYYLRHMSSDVSGLRAKQNGAPNDVSIFGFGSAAFSDDNEATWEVVNPSSIRRWNSYTSSVWAESANPLSTGWGGSQVTAASQFNSGAGNWSVRRVKMSGLPEHDLIGFQSTPPAGGGTYGVNGNGAWINLKPETRWESSFSATSQVYNLLNIPKNATAFINVQGYFKSCSYVNMTTATNSWLAFDNSVGFHDWPLTNITTIAKGGTAESGFVPTLQVVVSGENRVPMTVNMVIKEA